LCAATLAATATERTQVLRRELRFSFVPNARLVQRVFFAVACLNRSTDCPRNEPHSASCTVRDACEERELTCGDEGECVAIDVLPQDHGDASGRFDAGRDGAVRDSGVSLDAGLMDGARDSGARPCGDAAIGASCTPATACRTGTLQCNGGAVSCVATGMVAAGASCGAVRVCDLAGDCVACASGMACTPADPCRVGTIMCGAGEPSCGALRPAGSSCGTNRVCSPTGACVACVEGASCASANPCATATIACGSGAAVCTDRGAQPNGTACGSGRQCSSGACVCAASSGCGAGQLCVQGTCAQGSLVSMYACPSVGAGALGGGTWGYYGCTAQTWSVPSCVTIESPRNRTDACVSAGRMQLTQSAIAPAGATAVAMFQCPSLGGGLLGGGSWGYYECQGQLSSNASCLTIEAPTSRSTACAMAGYVAVYPSAPTAPPGGRVMQVYRCPVVGQGALGGGSWGYYGCRGQLTSNASCYTIEYPTNRVDSCASQGYVVLE
jgi:hypothetical protein